MTIDRCLIDGHSRSNSYQKVSFRMFSRRLLPLSFGVVVAFPILGQTESPIRGIVVAKDSQPLSGVSVSGGVWKKCCPYQQENVTTDENGEFLLEHPASVIHFWKPGLQPLTLVVQPKAAQIRIVMAFANNNLTVSTCGRSEANQRQLGWGKPGLHFIVPKSSVKIAGGKPDADYVRYVIRPVDRGVSYLELWFGPYSISAEPDDQQFLQSEVFSQRDLVSVKGDVIGRDSWGQLKGSLNWRQMAAFGSGATYHNASAEEARLFDKIMNSICMGEPNPSKR